MSDRTVDAIRSAIVAYLADADADAEVKVASGSGGHFSIEVASKAFAGKSMVESHRLVYAAIAPLMKGDAAPVHAVDTLKTTVR
jgi:stress-induced morphogen